jgi:1-acyl-sn-glycerol-3-phosphate acyltransferase
VDEGWSILVFPEGELSAGGEMQAFRPGVGVLARDLRLAVLPARIRGAWSVLPRGRIFPRTLRHPVGVAWGAPLVPEPGEPPEAFAARVEKGIRAL